MSNHHHKHKTEQAGGKAHGVAPFPFENMPYQASEPMESGKIQTKAAADDSSIQLRAYQIYREKGGSPLDNWLEAERILR